MVIEKMARCSKRFYYKPTGVEGDYDVYATHLGKVHLIATIRNREFKRVTCEKWQTTSWSDYLGLIQSYAGLNAAETGRTGPI